MIFLLEGDRLISRDAESEGQADRTGEARALRVGECLCGMAFSRGQPVYSSALRADSRCILMLCQKAGLTAFTALPLVSGKEILGVLGVGFGEERDFRGRESFLEAFANEVSAGLRNALLYEQVQGYAQELQTRLDQIYAGEQEVSQLTRQLQHVQRMEALGSLAGGIAHDFNNILSPIIMGAEMAQMQLPAAHPARDSLGYVLKAGVRAKDLVQQILTFSRQGDEEKKPLRAAPLIKEALKLIRASLPATIEIRDQIRAAGDTILGNPTHLHQIIMNLATNAAQAMSGLGGVLGVTLDNEWIKEDPRLPLDDLRSGNYLVLTVSDTGRGMDVLTRERIFEPFFTTKPRGEGTGMGLAVVHGIVKKYGGAIRVESEPGRGSVFTVLLPCAEEKELDQARQEEAVIGGSGRVMYVDDEPAITTLYGNMLQGLGYTVEQFTDSLQALDRFRDNPRAFDLIITDQTMPKLTGLELIGEVRRLRSDLPVILCTGFSEGIQGEAIRSLGLRNFLLKPIPTTEMARHVKAALEGTPTLQ